MGVATRRLSLIGRPGSLRKPWHRGNYSRRLSFSQGGREGAEACWGLGSGCSNGTGHPASSGGIYIALRNLRCRTCARGPRFHDSGAWLGRSPMCEHSFLSWLWRSRTSLLLDSRSCAFALPLPFPGSQTFVIFSSNLIRAASSPPVSVKRAAWCVSGAGCAAVSSQWWVVLGSGVFWEWGTVFVDLGWVCYP